MTFSVTSQQIAFFAKNGFLELEELLDEKERKAFAQTMKDSKANDWISGRDLWQKNPFLRQQLTSRKISGLALQMTGKTTLQLAFDQWVDPSFSLNTPTKIKELFSIQGLTCILVFHLTEEIFTPPEKAHSLGLFPFPKKPGSLLFIDPNLLINWPASSLPLYVVGYGIHPVYIQNLKDPAGGSLRKLGYEFGDVLKHETHPLIHRK